MVLGKERESRVVLSVVIQGGSCHRCFHHGVQTKGLSPPYQPCPRIRIEMSWRWESLEFLLTRGPNFKKELSTEAKETQGGGPLLLIFKNLINKDKY